MWLPSNNNTQCTILTSQQTWPGGNTYFPIIISIFVSCSSDAVLIRFLFVGLFEMCALGIMVQHVRRRSVADAHHHTLTMTTALWSTQTMRLMCRRRPCPFRTSTSSKKVTTKAKSKQDVHFGHEQLATGFLNQ